MALAAITTGSLMAMLIAVAPRVCKTTSEWVTRAAPGAVTAYAVTFRGLLVLGGHFAPVEQPRFLVADLRSFFGQLSHAPA
ncbi:hypothetical protein AB0D59_31670 [Streptomyces sp. NPDC048417]|uniref:hypothetical protein n=1 Tax=Streptomyces sp. NPDC048417 TaxID=3155387 RepID=UPI00344AB58E